MVRFLLLVALAVSPLAAKAAHPYDAVARVSPPGKMWGGSGVLIYKADGKGIVVTNAHVTAGGDTYDIVWAKQKRSATVVGFYPEYDLAYLIVEDPPVEPVKIGWRDTHIVFAGYPHYERDKLHWQYGNYIGEDFPCTRWQNAPVPGMSGGAVFDRKDGELCGIVRAEDGSVGIGVCDMVLIVISHGYEDPAGWVANDEEAKESRDYELAPGSLAKPKKRIVTKDIEDEEPPTWEETDEEND